MTEPTAIPVGPRRRRRLAGIALAACWAALALLLGKIALDAWMQQVTPMRNLPAWITALPIAHRGLHDRSAGVPENSLAAFDRAIEAGYAFEFDVHLLADGRLAVIHDFDLRRMTGDPRPVAQCTAEDLRPLRLDGTDQRIPLLEDVLQAVRGRVPVLIEIKNNSRTDRRLERALGAALAKYAGPVAVESFNPFSLAWFSKHMPAIPRGQIASDFAGEEMRSFPLPGWKKFILRHLLLTHYSRPAFISYDVRCLPAWAPRQKQLGGLPIVGWPVHCEAQRLEAMRFCRNVVFQGFRPPLPARTE